MSQFKKIILFILIGYFTISCSSTTEKFWVRGIKTPCDAGAGKMECLNIYKGDALDEAKWTLFYNQIEGFKFEKNKLQKIEVEKKKLKKGDIPADGSAYKYTLKKVLETEMDQSSLINGNWILATINGNPINRMAKLPNVKIDVDAMAVSGFDGCNTYSGPIEKITSTYMSFGILRGTQRMCIDMAVPNAFNKALSEVYAFHIEDGVLNLYNSSKNIVMTLMPYQESETAVDDRINNSWTLVKIYGGPIDRMDKAPTLLINTSKKMLMGDDGCNTFSGPITKATGTTITVGNIRKSQKACRNSDTTNQFNKALNNIESYTFEGDKLVLIDNKGEAALTFIPDNTN